MQGATVLKNSICQITGFHKYLRMEEGKKSTAEYPRLITLVEHSEAYKKWIYALNLKKGKRFKVGNCIDLEDCSYSCWPQRCVTEQEGLLGDVTLQMIGLKMNIAPLPSAYLHITINRTQLRNELHITFLK